MLKRFVYNALDDCLYLGEWAVMEYCNWDYYEIAEYILYEFDVFYGYSLYDLVPYVIEWTDWIYSKYY